MKMANERYDQYMHDVELLKALYNGDHLEPIELDRVKIVIKSLQVSYDERVRE